MQLHPELRPKSAVLRERLLSSRQSLAKVRPHLAAFGITRIGELTGLDNLGIPVAMAVRPNSYTLSVSLGKGADTETALISAAMEAVETAVAEKLPDDLLTSSIQQLHHSGCNIIDLKRTARCHPQRIGDKDELAWFSCRNIITSEDTMVPWSLIGMDHRPSPQSYHDAFYVSSDGLASGNTYSEAVFHGLCELVERDALARWQFASADLVRRSEIEPTGDEHAYLPALLELISRAGLQLRVFRMYSDTRLPVFMATLAPRHHLKVLAGGIRCGGCGCHPDPGRAIVGAITEAAQARLALVAGARDDIRRDHYQLGSQDNDDPESQSSDLHRISPADFPPLSTATDIDDHIRAVLARLQRLGIDQIHCAQLCTGPLNMCVVRIIPVELQIPLQGNRVQVTNHGMRNMKGAAA